MTEVQAKFESKFGNVETAGADRQDAGFKLVAEAYFRSDSPAASPEPGKQKGTSSDKGDSASTNQMSFDAIEISADGQEAEKVSDFSGEAKGNVKNREIPDADLKGIDPSLTRPAQQEPEKVTDWSKEKKEYQINKDLNFESKQPEEVSDWSKEKNLPIKNKSILPKESKSDRSGAHKQKDKTTSLLLPDLIIDQIII